MLHLLLCDASRPQKVAPICRRRGLGVEIQSFSNPDYPLEYTEGIELHQKQYEPITIRSLHGPFGDLSAGSCDRLIRQVTKERFEFAYHHAKLLDVRHIVLHHGYIPKDRKSVV